MNHTTIYREPGRYAGWPANYGIWSWGDEIVVGFTVGYHSSEGGFHARDRSRPFVGMQGRSLDGGETWAVVPTPCRTPGDRALSADEHMNADLHLARSLTGDATLEDCPGGIDFTHPDFALMCARTGLRAGASSFFYTSADRCRIWDGPFRLPMFDQTGIAARTDYLVSGPAECTLFLTASKPDGQEGRVFCARTVDGGRTFRFVAWIGPQPAGYAIMPAAVRLPAGRLLCAVRRREADRCWIDLYASDDSGETWSHRGSPVPDTGRGGNPPTMALLRDGRLCMTYGFRDAPFSLCARLSDSGGAAWGKEVVLRTRAGNHNIGYPRTIQRQDGKMVTVYYFNEHPEGERFIAATVWEP